MSFKCVAAETNSVICEEADLVVPDSAESLGVFRLPALVQLNARTLSLPLRYELVHQSQRSLLQEQRLLAVKLGVVYLGVGLIKERLQGCV